MLDVRAAAARGQLEEALRRERQAVRRVTSVAVEAETRKLQLAIRAEVNRAFAGGRGGRAAGNAIRSKLYRNEDGNAGLVYSRFGRRGPDGQFIDYLVPFAHGAVITPRNSRWLYIPLEAGRRARRGRRLSVALDPNLAFVPSADGKRVWLVRRTPRGKRTTLVALLVRRVAIEKRLDLEAPIRQAEQNLPQALLDAIEKPTCAAFMTTTRRAGCEGDSASMIARM